MKILMIHMDKEWKLLKGNKRMKMCEIDNMLEIKMKKNGIWQSLTSMRVGRSLKSVGQVQYDGTSK